MKRDYTNKIETISNMVHELVLDFLSDVVIEQMEDFGIDDESEDWDAIHDAICNKVIAMLQA
jgi:phosphoribosylformylglycinamidine (FGAM) synthase PurS component